MSAVGPDPAEDPEAVAEAAGLTYVTDHAPGPPRIRRGRGLSYVDRRGTVLPDVE